MFSLFHVEMALLTECQSGAMGRHLGANVETEISMGNVVENIVPCLLKLETLLVETGLRAMALENSEHLPCSNFVFSRFW